MRDDLHNIEELKYYFNPKTGSGNSLPKISTVSDNLLFVLINGNTKSLYIANGGQWNLIGTLNPVSFVPKPSTVPSSSSDATLSTAGMVVYEYNFDSTTPNGSTIYQIAKNELIIQVVIIVKTAFNGTSPTLSILDTLGATIFDSADNSLMNVGVYVNPQKVNSKYSSAANLYLSLSLGGATTGNGTIYLTTQKF